MLKNQILKEKFYQRDTVTVAKELLGKKLTHIFKGQAISGLITETEAYLGVTDKACHTYAGKKTAKTQSMYLKGGHAYVYLIYGLYYCFNVVTRTEEHPEAVLIRSLEPVAGIDQMKIFRKKEELKDLTTGPGKLCEAMAINKSHDGVGLQGQELFIQEGISITPAQIITKPRVGIDYAEESKDWPLRFYVKDSKFISKR